MLTFDSNSRLNSLVLGRFPHFDPRPERIILPLQRRLQFREVPRKHTPHRLILNPFQPLLRVRMLPPRRAGKESVTFNPPARHQDKHPEGCIAKSESFWQWLGEHANEKINLLEIAGVDSADLICELLVSSRELEESGGCFHMKESAEFAVSWDSSLAVSQDVYGCDVPCLSIRSSDLA